MTSDYVPYLDRPGANVRKHRPTAALIATAVALVSGQVKPVAAHADEPTPARAQPVVAAPVSAQPSASASRSPGGPRLESQLARLLVPTITLAFDDGTSDHAGAARLLEGQGLRGVFYVNSGRLGLPGYLTTGQALQMQQRGHEIGGHTVFHLRLSQQDEAEQQRQICTDRNQLIAAGIHAADFAYPFNDFTPATQQLVRACGYASARTTGGLGCAGCPTYESLLASDPFATRALSGFGPQTTAADLENAVNRVMLSGGWLQLIFHRFCTTTCGSNAVRLEEFAAFVRWLALRHTAGLITNATVQQALHAEQRPTVTAPAPTSPPTFANRSLEEPGSKPGAPPRCFSYGSSDDSSATAWTLAPDAHTGRVAMRAALTDPTTTTRLTTTQDLGSCAPTVVGGASYRLGLWYKASRSFRTATFLRQPGGGYRALGSTREIAASPTWRLATWDVGPMPARTGMAVSAAVIVAGSGTYTVDDFSLAELTSVSGAAVAGAGGQSGAAGHRPDGVAAGKPAANGERRRPARPDTTAGTAPGAAFTPPNGGPPVADGRVRQVVHHFSAQSPWVGRAELAGALLVAFAVLILLDRRIRLLHRRTRRRIPSNETTA
ncbi:polysaccharide deacetylase family protein [Actinoplanes sp. CA-030573]|uniref:polysaccharide deacetylase family protein n=1 Tax=Actinoplanes sp. CA-030573 TaxID=3239898 RepID=UPI003D8AC64C